MNKYALQITGITDGDTVKGHLIAHDINIAIPYQRFRLMYVDTPERKAPKFEEAKQFTADHLEIGKVYDISLYEMDSFGRWLSVIYVEEGVSINELLLKNGLAEPYI